jgi:hypothetical protein
MFSIPTPEETFKPIIDQFTADLSPLTSAHHNFAKIKVKLGHPGSSSVGYTLDVYAPERCRIYVPSTYVKKSNNRLGINIVFDVRFFPWDPAALTLKTKIFSVPKHDFFPK